MQQWPILQPIRWQTKRQGRLNNKRGLGGKPTTFTYTIVRKGKTDWNKWNNKHMSFPVAYWVEQNQIATGGLPITSGLVARFNADCCLLLIW